MNDQHCNHKHDDEHDHSCDGESGQLRGKTCGDNVAARLSLWAKRLPGAIAIAEPTGPVQTSSTGPVQTSSTGPVQTSSTGAVQTSSTGAVQTSSARSYNLTTYKELDDQSDRIALGLIRWGVRPGMRIVMLVPFGAMFIRLTFALLKAGAVVVLIDPGMGRKHLVNCLSESKPDGFVGIPKAQAIRTLLRGRFPNACWNVTVGRRWFWGGKTLQWIESYGAGASDQAIELPNVSLNDDAAIIFTTGSTGPPKGVAYTQGTFNAQVDMIRDRYNIKPGTRDLACFPLFGLYDNVMGATTIIPDMDPTRPADVNPQRLFEAIQQWEIDQAFGSPALWHRVVSWCEETGNHFPTLRRVLSAGAPVPAKTLQQLRRFVHPEADICTPYGATEALPLASIESRQVIAETGPAAAKGRGVCVGTRFDGIRWMVIEINDGPIAEIEDSIELPRGKIGELMVTGRVVTRRYAVRQDQNALHKVADGDWIWHRMGDVGYLDENDQFWFCGRKAHRVRSGKKTWYTIPCEAIFNSHPAIYRSALVGRGQPGSQSPVIIVEPHESQRPRGAAAKAELIAQLSDLAIRNPLTRRIEDIRIHPGKLPVDIRHNSKIFREQLSAMVNP